MVELYPERDALHTSLATAYAEKGLFDEALDEGTEMASSLTKPANLPKACWGGKR